MLLDLIIFVALLPFGFLPIVAAYQMGGWLAAGLVTLLFVIAIPWQLQWWQEEEKRRQRRGNY
ncbi:MAG: hypothetical protein J5820_03245 [Rhodocyclaceae bacterium]|nr:hypothetical protein [Rhodocyclaceae bacterium]